MPLIYHLGSKAGSWIFVDQQPYVGGIFKFRQYLVYFSMFCWTGSCHCLLGSSIVQYRQYVVVFVIEALEACNWSDAFFCFVLTLDTQGAPISLHDPSDSLHTFHNKTTQETIVYQEGQS